jgi:hypothetical protein
MSSISDIQEKDIALDASFCKNCRTEFAGNFCPCCGQKKYDRKDFVLKEFLKDLAEEAFDFDSKIFNTLRLLILKPGQLTFDFINGVQKKYIGPVKLYLIIITLNFLVYSIFDSYSPINVQNFLENGDQAWFRALIEQNLKESQLDKITFLHQLNASVNSTLSISLYLLIFIFALILKGYYYKSGKYYVEHLIFCLHFMAFGFLRDTLTLPMHMYNKNIGAAFGVITTVIYFFFSIKIVYGNVGIKRWLNTLLLYGFFFTLFITTIIFSILFNVLF